MDLFLLSYCWSEILMVENMTIIVDTKRVSIDTKLHNKEHYNKALNVFEDLYLVWRNQFLNVLNSHISASYSKKFSNTNLDLKDIVMCVQLNDSNLSNYVKLQIQ